VPLASGGAAEFALVEDGLHRIRVVLGGRHETPGPAEA
jgi:hypothetical protein